MLSFCNSSNENMSFKYLNDRCSALKTLNFCLRKSKRESSLLDLLFSLLCALCSLLFTLYALPSPLYSLLSTLYSLLLTFYSLLTQQPCQFFKCNVLIAISVHRSCQTARPGAPSTGANTAIKLHQMGPSTMNIVDKVEELLSGVEFMKTK